jgi:hypothetical protein
LSSCHNRPLLFGIEHRLKSLSGCCGSTCGILKHRHGMAFRVLL